MSRIIQQRIENINILEIARLSMKLSILELKGELLKNEAFV